MSAVERGGDAPVGTRPPAEVAAPSLNRVCPECENPAKAGHTFCDICGPRRRAASKRRHYLNKRKAAA